MSLNYIVEDDYGQVITLTVLDTDTNSAADISGYATTIQIQLKDPSGNIAAKTATYFTDGSDGIILYTLADGDIDEAGRWYIRAKVTAASAVLSSHWTGFDVGSAT